MDVIFFIVAVALLIWGILSLLDGAIIVGILLIVAACLVGPGGYSIFRRR